MRTKAVFVQSCTIRTFLCVFCAKRKILYINSLRYKNRSLARLHEKIFILYKGTFLNKEKIKIMADHTELHKNIKMISQTYEQIKESIAKRDEIDKNKKEGALKVAPDALYIDTSDLTIDNVCDIILRQINK
mgnify:CR=1 FL=1